MPRVTVREAERAILRDGWYRATATGTSHRHYHHPTKVGRVMIAFHGSQILDVKTTRSIIQQERLTIDQFRDLL